MTNRINQQSIPAYSGITINITSPTLNAAPLSTNCCNNNCPEHQNVPTLTVEQNSTPLSNNNYAQYGVTNPIAQNTKSPNLTKQNQYNQAEELRSTTDTQNIEKLNNISNTDSTTSATNNSIKEIETLRTQESLPQAYPPQYYLNNYNYIQNGEKNNPKTNNIPKTNNEGPTKRFQTQPALNSNPQIEEQEDMTASQDIISELDTRVAEQNFVPVVDDRGVFIGIVTRKAVITYLCEVYEKFNSNQNF
jgi:hypothetical protein